MTAASATTARVSPFAIYLLGIVAGLQMIDPAAANVAIVEAGRQLSFGPLDRALGASISTLALAATVLASGIAADRLGRRNVLIGGVLLAIVGNLIVAVTPVTAGYMLGRALAGIGVGAALAASYAYVRFVTPPEKVGAALGLWNAIMLAAMLVGVLASGALAAIDWRFALLIVPVVGILTVPAILAVLPPMPRTGSGPIDYPGLIAIGAGMVLLLFGISNAAADPSGPATIFPIIGGLVAFVLFAVIEARQGEHATIPIGLFTRAMFIAAIVSGIAWNIGQAVVQLQTSNFWQYVQRQNTLEVSLSQLPFLLVVAVASLFVGSLLSGRRLTLRTAMIVGFIALTAGYLMLAFVAVDTPYWFFLPALVVLGIGLSAVSVPQSVMFVSEAPEAYYGAVTSFRTTVGQLGYAIGLAGGVVLVQAIGQFDLVRQLEKAGVPPSNVGAGLGEIRLYINQGTQPVGEAGQQALAGLGDAYAAGFNGTMLITAAMMLILGVITIVFMSRRPAPPAA